jgi:hypothetical protein
MQSQRSDNGGVLVVTGHAIYQDYRWQGGRPGEDRYYEGHVTDGLRIARSSGYKAICFSGGRTRERRDDWPAQVINSEAEGMISFARDMGMIGCPPPFILAESFARDYFENVFFSILCFRREFGQWPSRVGVVSWKFRAVRFYLIATGIRLGDGCFTFYGSGDPHLTRTREVVAATSARNDSALIQLVDGEPKIVDPLHRHKDAFASKRFGRMPKDCVSNEEYMVRVKTAYDEDFDLPNKRQGEVSSLIDAVEKVDPGPGWRDIVWPWSVK